MDKQKKLGEEEALTSPSNDREQSLASNFEDPPLGELSDPSTLLSETADAVKELVQNALEAPLAKANTPKAETGSLHITQGIDTQSLAPLRSEDTNTGVDLTGLDHEPHMEIQPGISMAQEVNSPDGDNLELSMDTSTQEALTFVAKSEMAERLFELVLCELRFEALVEAVLGCVMKSVDAQAGSILELDRGSDEFFFRASLGGGDPEKLKAFRVPRNKGIVGHVAESGQILLLQDMEDNQMQLKAISMSVGFETRSCLAAPILVANQLYGVIELFNKSGVKYFDAKDQAVLEDALKMVSKVLEVRFFVAELVRHKK